MADEIEGKGFVIKDRRRLEREGEKEEAKGEKEKERFGEYKSRKDGQPGEERTAEGEEGTKKGEAGADLKSEDRREQRPVKIDFEGFIFSLYTSAMLHFGDMPDPITGKREKNLNAAKQMIDIMGMLEEKTRGNLTKEEENTLEALLYELRMRFVKES
ncbi:MAG: DUF1844 domain-containing protein [Anaerovoracaceae bacterium]